MNPLLGTILSPTRMSHGTLDARLAIYNERAEAKRRRDAQLLAASAVSQRIQRKRERARTDTCVYDVKVADVPVRAATGLRVIGGNRERQTSPEDVEVEAQRRDFRERTGDEIYSYNYRVPQAAIAQVAANIDWRRGDIAIKDEWFMPATFDELVADDKGLSRRSLEALHQWLHEWDEFGRGERADPPDQCAALLKGRPGVGKSSCVRLLLQEFGFEKVIMINASQERGKSVVYERLVPTFLTASCAPGPRRTAIVLEEVDGLHSSGHGGADALVNFLSAQGDSKADIESKLRTGETLTAEDCSSWSTISAKLQPSKHIRMPLIARQVPRLRDVYVRRALRGVRSVVLPCPLFLLANEHQYHNYLRTLQRHTLYAAFTPVRDYTLARSLYPRLSERWKVVWSHDPQTNEHLAVRMATAACGDVRKAVTMFTTAMRRAYAEKQLLLQAAPDTLSERHRERREREANERRLVIRARHCAGFLQRQTAAPSSIFQMISYLGRDASSPAYALDVVTRYRVPQIPDMLYENYPLMAPSAATPQRANSKSGTNDDNQAAWDRLAMIVRTADLANVFSVAERYRRLFDFIRDESTQMYYHASTTLWPMLLARGACDALCSVVFVRDDGTVRRGRVAARNMWRVQFDKPSIEGHRGICAQWRQMAIQERNMYDAMRTPQARWQSSADVFLLFQHYATSMRQTRSRNSMLDMLKPGTVLKHTYRDRIESAAGGGGATLSSDNLEFADDDDQKIMAALVRKRKVQDKAKADAAKQRQRAKRTKTAAQLKNHDVRDMFLKKSAKRQ